jgi:hypothetical protein
MIRFLNLLGYLLVVGTVGVITRDLGWEWWQIILAQTTMSFGVMLVAVTVAIDIRNL